MRRMQRLAFATLSLAALFACSDPSGVELEAVGVVAGTAYFDRDGDGRRDNAVDIPVAGVVAAVLLEATDDTVAQATTGADGSFAIGAIPVGRYRLVGRRGALLGDTVEVVQIDSAPVLPDAALYLLDPAADLSYDAASRILTVPFVVNPAFGQPLRYAQGGRLLRVGISLTW